MKKRWLGIPVPVISVILALVLISGGVLAAWFMTLEQPATVRITGAEVTAWLNEACDEPMPTTLDFGDMGAGDTSDPVSFWLLNNGDYTAYMALSTTGLDTLLTLTETNGVVPANPGELKLVVVGEYYQMTTTTTTITMTLDAPRTTDVSIANGDPFPSSGVVKIDDELILYQSKTGISLVTLTRGHAGTTAVIHLTGATVTLVELIPDDFALVVDGKLGVTLILVAGEAITRDDYPFTLNITGYDDPNYTP